MIFIRGVPGELIEDVKTGNLTLLGENTLLGKHYRYTMDMVILSVGIRPRKDSEILQRLLNLSTDTDGFYMEAHPKLRPVDTTTGGVFLAGAAEGPKDIKDSVTQASAAASRAKPPVSGPVGPPRPPKATTPTPTPPLKTAAPRARLSARRPAKRARQ